MVSEMSKWTLMTKKTKKTFKSFDLKALKLVEKEAFALRTSNSQNHS
jgi:hypothetical protein